ncbi:HIT family protein [Thermococcus thioreducens]|uniref:Diadenosine tetraphosphate (Ap4A) hydrolase n=1 Tax=Thermococcus thioreducens TaxID=277988 RepID=A0A0Q2UMP8_9EURY|nr:HIT family protein [Thermococcus thioreducens]ASJ11766.1 HIT family hydrolase [Thermococcus thioreducens]KQH81944.1 HIT family hydrolase [Thermococcus thioreducens]SEW14229.1 Diadenosine tetraphosphate (Ap4A) hydrolase [Thermococcus thioreducens]
MECPFCNAKREAILYDDGIIRILIDSYPANRGHLLVVPGRHVESWEELSGEEKAALIRGMELAMEKLREVLKPDGFNVGMNLGRAAGQTVPHIHLHVIPRWMGDCAHPRGGVRKAVLDLEDENLSMRERWVKNRLREEEVERLREAFRS